MIQRPVSKKSSTISLCTGDRPDIRSTSATDIAVWLRNAKACVCIQGRRGVSEGYSFGSKGTTKLSGEGIIAKKESLKNEKDCVFLVICLSEFGKFFDASSTLFYFFQSRKLTFCGVGGRLLNGSE
jgi:hypothetical protein